ncbi:Sec-independent protein translocase subunit TatA [Streptomyces tagetis]|uniref:Sec-independent protein translocase protein TatA n=1 Tax=Streptomyces tagetis TaxID=2820809 RepID=A0A940XHA4_9ACTN|nr:Sec-independent protein translocase subunit TatA [Streptomyces sp. RG38]MBQ0827162.1 Sec-independent protein translocase subunit TatA [Streptomyces sp. RG38]
MLRNGLEPWHLLVVAVVFIVLFGSKKLPEAARGLGRSMRILKSEAQAMKGDAGSGATGSGTPAPGEPSGAAPGSDAQGPRAVPGEAREAEHVRPAAGERPAS